MKKYISIAKNTIAEIFAYRLNFILWRVRMIISVLITFFLWQAIYGEKDSFFGYGKVQMFTYIIMLLLINSFIQTNQVFKVAAEINYGTLSSFLIRPLNYLGNILSRDIAERLINVIFSIFELYALFYIFHFPFLFQTDFRLLTYFIISLIIAGVLFFEINLLLSIFAFWTKDTWSPRFVFNILIVFLAGYFFPLDILPKAVFEILMLTPFAYLVFFPLNVYLGRIDAGILYGGMIISVFWAGMYFVILNILWHKGLKAYMAEGG